MTLSTASIPQETAQAALISDARRRWTLAILTAIFACNYVDRTIISILGQSIKEEMHLADWQIGILGGLAFAICNVIAGIPIARLAERYNRVSILMWCLAFWSAMTALCGKATSFSMLLLFRGGVGIGEAAGTPTAHSLIADYYPADRRASALSIFSLGIPAGMLVGAVVGGYLAQHYGWRIAFFILGIPGLALALLGYFTLREPPRGHCDDDAVKARAVAPPPPLLAVIKLLCSTPALVHLMIAITISSFVANGMGQFAALYYAREFGLDYAQVGLVHGLVSGVAITIGMLLGGFGADWAGKRDRRWYSWIPAVGFVVATPLYIFAYTRGGWESTAWALLLPGILTNCYLAPAFAVIHNTIEVRMRATAVALLAVLLNLVGLGLGPPFVGLMIDIFSSHIFAQSNVGVFAQVCHYGAIENTIRACPAALGTGTRYALIVAVLVNLWAAAHYFLAGRHMRPAASR